MLPVILRVEDNSRTAEARSAARRLAQKIGFDQEAAERAAIVVTEACTNLMKHASGGTIVLTANGHGNSARGDNQPCVEMLAFDRGPGMANWQACLADGYSTTGTPGNGLGAISRLSAFCDVYSQPGHGTVLFAVIAADAKPPLPAPRVCAIRMPKPNQEVCGDDWAVKHNNGLITVLVADGLGHGPEAAEASRCAVAVFDKHADAAPKELLESVHYGLRHTRGAAVSITELNEDRRIAVFAGLGNVAGRLCNGGGAGQQMISMNGTAGVETRAAFREFTYPWPRGTTLVMHSDGLNTHWDATDYPRILTRSTAMIAGAVFRDCYRGNDDATIVAAA